MRSPLHVAGGHNGMERAMNMQRVRLGLLSNCSLLMARVARGCKAYILNDNAEREWMELAAMEAVAELRAQQSRDTNDR